MANNSYFSASYLLLAQEGHLIRSCLTTGLTELRSAHVNNKGAFYSALFNLSIGIERLLKAIVIINHMLTNNLSVPSKKQLKDSGHNIVQLYDTCISIAHVNNVNIPIRATLDNINQEILSLLSDFAQSTRYHNLDALSSSQNGKDPLSHLDEIISAILNNDVPETQRKKILQQGKLAADAINDITFTIMHGLDKSLLSTEKALSLPGLHDQAMKYVVLRIITMLVPFRTLISELSLQAYSLNSQAPAFPQMQEFLEWLWGDRNYVLRKKKWP